MRDAGRIETPDGDVIEQAIVRQIALLWQTRPLRRERLYVADEVEAALAYMRDIFLPVLPALYARWERAAHASAQELPAARQLDRRRPRRQSQRHRRLAAAGTGARVADGAGRLSGAPARDGRGAVDLERAGLGDQGGGSLAEDSGDNNPTRRDEPYRRAITGIYARLAATYKKLTGRTPPRPASVSAEAYPDAESLRSDLLALEQSLETSSRGWLGRGGALARLIRAVETFGFHLATLDLRQNADVHERVVAELLKVAGVEADYLALDEATRVELLRRELAGERLLASPFASYSAETLSELAIVRAAAEAHALYGPACITTYIVSKCDSVSDLLEVNILLKEAGLYRPPATPPRRRSWWCRCSRRSAI